MVKGRRVITVIVGCVLRGLLCVWGGEGGEECMHGVVKDGEKREGG